MQIPKHFTLHGHLWTVEISRTLKDEESAFGEMLYYQKKIIIYDPQNHTYAHSFIEQVFFHELVHAIQTALSWEADTDTTDDTQVDLFGELWHQYEATKTGNVYKNNGSRR